MSTNHLLWLANVVFALLATSSTVAVENEQAMDWYTIADPDQSDWSSKRVSSFSKYKNRLGQFTEPQAILSIPDRNISVAVYPDTLSGSLEAGVSWVSGTAAPGAPGNVAIAGHRDGFFRRLEAIPVGTQIHLELSDNSQIFEVQSVRVVNALDITPLEPLSDNVLTLITCHPFYFKGYAPDRYIVRAILIDEPVTQDQLTWSTR